MVLRSELGGLFGRRREPHQHKRHHEPSQQDRNLQSAPHRGRSLGVAHGLIVRDPYASQLLNGEKIWEIRGRPTQIRGTVVIIKSGTGHAFGTVKLVRVLGPLQLGDLVDAAELPDAEREQFRVLGLPYRQTFAYIVSNPWWFQDPIPYRHPSGAVIWVNLPDLDLSKVAYASSPRRDAQLSLV